MGLNQFERFPIWVRDRETDQLLTPAPWCGAWALSLYQRCDVHCVYCSSAMQGAATPICVTRGPRAAQAM